MKINRNEVDRIYNTQVQANKSTAKDKSEASDIKDKVVISDKAREYSAMNSLTVTAVGDVTKTASPEKLLKLKNDIASGSYSVSSENIAQGILGLKDNSQSE